MNQARGLAATARGRTERFLMFAFVGSVGTAIQYGVLGLGVALGTGHPVACSAVGYALGSVANYLLNHRFTFRSRAPHLVAASRYYTVLAVGWLINLCLMSVFVVGVGWGHWISQLLTTVIGLLWNYSGSNWWAFRFEDSACGHFAGAAQPDYSSAAGTSTPPGKRRSIQQEAACSGT